MYQSANIVCDHQKNPGVRKLHNYMIIYNILYIVGYMQGVTGVTPWYMYYMCIVMKKKI